MSTYLYRCTEQQLETHLQRIAEEGDAVEHVIYKGGRDYVLVCRKALPQTLADVAEAIAADLRAIRETVSNLSSAVNHAAGNGRVRS